MAFSSLGMRLCGKLQICFASTAYGCCADGFHNYHSYSSIGFQDYCGGGERGMRIEQVKTVQNLLFLLIFRVIKLILSFCQCFHCFYGERDFQSSFL